MSDHDDTIEPAEAHAISRALGDVAPPSPEVMNQHIANALTAFDAESTSRHVVSLAERRARFQPRLAVAAAALLVIGGFTGWVSRGSSDSTNRSPSSSVIRNSVRPCMTYEGDYLGDVKVKGSSFAIFLRRSTLTLDVVLLDPVTCAVPTSQP